MINDMPTKCAQAIPVSLRVSWASVAHVCSLAQSTTPANCIAHRIRRREAVSDHLVQDCRRAVAVPASLEIARVAFQCVNLVPDCLLSISLSVLRQFSGEMPGFSGELVRMNVDQANVEEEISPLATPKEYVRGPMVASIVNGSAVLNNLAFLVAGSFTVSFRSPVVAEPKLARIQIHGDAQANLLRRSCSTLFFRLECHGTPPHAATANGREFTQLLHLPHRHYLSALSCETHWQEHTGGLQFQRSTSTGRIYTINPASYYLLTSPSDAMSPWELLGLHESANRSAIRRAYHKKSLEWHPDKWSATDLAPFRPQGPRVHALVTEAYHLLHAKWRQ